MGVPLKRPAETIDITPSWRGILPLLVALIENSNEEGRATALEELGRMAAAADAYNELVEAKRGPPARRRRATR